MSCSSQGINQYLILHSKKQLNRTNLGRGLHIFSQNLWYKIRQWSGIKLDRQHWNVCVPTWVKDGLIANNKSTSEGFPFLNLWLAVNGKEINEFMKALLSPFYSNSLQWWLSHPYLLLIKIRTTRGERIISAKARTKSKRFFLIQWKQQPRQTYLQPVNGFRPPFSRS